MSRSRRVKAGCVAALIILLLLCLGAAWFEVTFQSTFFLLNRDRSSIVAQSMAWALMQNRSDVAKELVDEAQWPRLDKWMAGHKDVGCIQSGIPDEGSLQMVGPYTHESEGSVFIEIPFLYISAVCIGFDYDLSMTDIKMRSTPDGWLIVDWGVVSESIYIR